MIPYLEISPTCYTPTSISFKGFSKRPAVGLYFTGSDRSLVPVKLNLIGLIGQFLLEVVGSALPVGKRKELDLQYLRKALLPPHARHGRLAPNTLTAQRAPSHVPRPIPFNSARYTSITTAYIHARTTATLVVGTSSEAVAGLTHILPRSCGGGYFDRLSCILCSLRALGRAQEARSSFHILFQ
ncbi:hypothetical protein BDN72DRAFT_580498 [Pluteus cervinus]|uniref:Uncharacterized protein n=1 Tax=Pluteus cervinus TaxID=181527 RepID=A0ACD3A226_9AGAR|nr:hypothetical protein BDN72DRAFT_580498 [Pluteus cervinus]